MTQYITQEDIDNAEKETTPSFGPLGSVVDYRTYRRWIPEQKRRETFFERNARVVNYNISLAEGLQSKEELEEEAKLFYEYLNNLLVWGSGRTAWVAGTKATELVPESTMNCSASIVNRIEVFAEALHLLCLGCGFGFRILPTDVEQIPELKHVGGFVLKNDTYFPRPKEYRQEETTYTLEFTGDISDPPDLGILTIHVGDSREGWVSAFCALLQLYTGISKTTYFNFGDNFSFESVHYVKYNFDSVRPEGERIKGFGGAASGPEPLMKLISETSRIIEQETTNKKLRPINCMDIMCVAGDIVRSGNIRRSSLITLFHYLDQEVRNAKRGIWTDPNLSHKRYRSMSNNSILYDDGYHPSREELKELMQIIRFEGEPGFVRADKHKERRYEAALKWRPEENPSNYVEQAGITNPCGEINLTGGYGDLKAGSFCNLVSVPLTEFITESKEVNWSLLDTALRLVTKFAIRQTLIDISLPDWDFTQKKERLLGVDLCGIWEAFDKLGISVLSEEANNIRAFCRSVANDEATLYSKKLEIPRPLLVTTGKPNGCLTKEFIRTFSEGLLYIDEIADLSDLGVCETYSDLTEASTGNKILHAYNNGLSEVVKVTLQNGREIKCTPQHPLYVKEKGFVEACALEKGDFLDFYEGEKPLYFDKGSYQELKSVVTQKRWNRVINQPHILDEDLAWFLGQYFANGSHSKSKNRDKFRIHSGHKEVIKKAQYIFEKKFGYTPYVYKYKDRDSSQIEWSGKHFSTWLAENGLDKTNAKTLSRIPKLIRKSPYSVIMAFIAGYADGDGCFFRGSFCIDSSSKDWIENLIQVLEALGFSCSLIENSQRKSLGKGSLWKTFISRTYSNSLALEYFNKFSVKAQDKPIAFSNNRQCTKYPYAVVDVQYQDLEFTYDIEVENSHYYFQGGIKSHNTYAQLKTISSGCHPPYAPYYIRRIRIASSDALAKTLIDQGVPYYPETSEWESYFRKNLSHLIAKEGDKEITSVWDMLQIFDDFGKPLLPEIKTLVFEFPVKTSATRSTSEISAIEQLENYKAQMVYYIDHNQSITVSVGDDEWDEVAEWFFNNWDYVIGVSLLPKFADNVYPLLPYQECTKDEYDFRVSQFSHYPLEVDPSILNKYELEIEASNKDLDDVDVNLAGECSGSACPIR